MSNTLTSLDLDTLQTVTGGTQRGGGTGNIDQLVGTLNSLTSSIKDIKSKTSGFGDSEMMLLCMLALQQRSSANVVYVGRRRGGW